MSSQRDRRDADRLAAEGLFQGYHALVDAYVERGHRNIEFRYDLRTVFPNFGA